MYEDSYEEERYLSSLQRENEAIETLIKEQSVGFFLIFFNYLIFSSFWLHVNLMLVEILHHNYDV